LGEYGETMIEKSGADASFGFMIRYAIADIMAEEPPPHAVGHTVAHIINHVEKTLEAIPSDKYFVHFIENHDIERWASIVGRHEGKLRCGAVLNFFLPGIPAIYYGQELGVTGLVHDWSYDVNHLPVREAFPWTPDPSDPGIAAFYKDTGPWWDISYFVTGESQEFALSAQQDDPNSLWNFYRELIEFRKQSEALSNGDFRVLHPARTTFLPSPEKPPESA
jgi:alpha-amylase